MMPDVILRRGVVLLLSFAAAAVIACSGHGGHGGLDGHDGPDGDDADDSSAAVSAQTSAGKASQGKPAQGRYTGPLPPPPTSPYAAAPPDVIRAVYEFAARRPDVLRYVPCFCGCERNGHKGNEDCFVAQRAPDGRPQWDAHGLT